MGDPTSVCRDEFPGATFFRVAEVGGPHDDPPAKGAIGGDVLDGRKSREQLYRRRFRITPLSGGSVRFTDCGCRAREWLGRTPPSLPTLLPP